MRKLLHGLIPSVVLFFLTVPTHAQTDSLSLSSTSASAGATVPLNLTLAGSTQPAALAWTLSYSSASITSLTVSAGAVATAASKTPICASISGSTTCVISGLNQNAMANGVAAVVNVTLSGSASGTVNITVTNVSAADPNGVAITASGSGGSIVIGGAPPTLSSLSCAPGSLNSGGTSTCTVTMSGTGGGTVSLSSNNAALTVPGSVVVSASATTATFTATAGTISSSQTATVTATFGGGQQTATISLVAAANPTVSSLACVPSSLGTGATTSCTITLSGTAPSGGATVTLSSNNALLTVPASVVVNAGATTNTFTGTAGTISSNQTATVTATYNSSSQPATVSLVVAANPTVSSLACAPSIVGTGSTATCTITLSGAAPSGGATVTVSSNNAGLSVPASAAVSAGATTKTFTATAGTISSNQTATVTATYNSSSKTASVSLAAAIVVSSVGCVPTSLASGASATCTVTLSQTVGSSTTVSLASNNALLTVPPSTVIAAGTASGMFGVTAGSITTAQTATVTASYNASSQSTPVSLTAPGGGTGGGGTGGGGTGGGGGGGNGLTTISSFSCIPIFVPAGTAATCNLTLSSAAPTAGATVTLSSDNAGVTVPAQLGIAAGASATSFSAMTAMGTAGQSANLTASYNGSVVAASFAITGSAGVSSLTCSPSAVGSGGTTTCTVTLTLTAAGSGADVTLSSNTALITVPASITIPTGTNSSSFTATVGSVNSAQSGVITAGMNGTSQTVTLSLSQGSPQGAISSLTCTPDPVTAGTLDCTVQLASAAPAGGTNITLQGATSTVQMPAQVQVAAGAQSAQFKATVLASDQDQQIHITAALNGTANSTAVSVLGIRPISVVCPSSIQAGGSATCVVRLSSTNVPAVARLSVTTSSANLKVPVSMTTRLRQTRLTFTVQSDALSTQQSATVSVQFGSTTVSSPLAIQQQPAPVLTVPGDQAVVAGNPLSFTVSAADPGGLAVTLSAANLPAGASLDPGTGAFSWTPTAAQAGTYSLGVTATNTASASTTAQITVYVDPGQPVITDIRNAASQGHPACSAGSVGSVIGRWLASTAQPVSDLTGQSMSLSGTQVLVNGNPAPVLTVSSRRIDFLCPSVPAGTVLNVSVQNGVGTSNPSPTTTQDVGIGVYSSDGSGAGQGTILLSGTSLLATSRSFQNLGQPAQIGDAITVRVTGLGDAGSALPTIKIGNLYARADSVNPVPGMAGVYDVTVTVPPGVSESQTLPISVVSPQPQGAACAPGVLTPGTWPSPPSGSCPSATRPDETVSNTVTAAVELGS